MILRRKHAVHQSTTPLQTERYSRPRHLAASFLFAAHAKNRKTPLPNRPIRWRTLYYIFVGTLNETAQRQWNVVGVPADFRRGDAWTRASPLGKEMFSVGVFCVVMAGYAQSKWGKLTTKLRLNLADKYNVSVNNTTLYFIIIIIIIIIINIKNWALWSVPSPDLQLFAPTLLRSSNCSPSVWIHTNIYIYIYIYHHPKHQGLDPLIRSVSTVTAARSNASSVFQLFSFLVVCSGMISKGFGFVAVFANVKASSICIHPSCLVCLWSVVRGVCSHLFCGHKVCSLPEVSVSSFLPLQFFVFVRLLESNFLTHIKM